MGDYPMEEVSNVRDYREGADMPDRAVRESELSNRVQAIEKSLNGLGERVDGLSGQLRGVLRPDTPRDADGLVNKETATEATHAPLVEDLVRINMQINRIARNIDSIQNRLDT